MILARGPLLSFLHLLVPGREALNPGYDFAILPNGAGGYFLDCPDNGSRYAVGTIVELLLAIGEFRAVSPDWELRYVVL